MKTKTILLSAAACTATLLCLLANTPDADASTVTAVVPAAGIALAGKKTVPSTLKQATVFFTGAELTHTASVKLVKGPNEMTIEGLSRRLDLNSMKIKVKGSAMVSSYEFTLDYLSTAKKENPEAERLRKLIEEKNSILAQLKVEQGINANMLQYLATGITKNVSGSESGLGIDELKKTMEYYRLQAAELEAAKITLADREKKLLEEIAALQAQLNQEATKNNKVSGILRLNLSSNVDAETEISISYFTSAAGWTPYYDINVESAGKPVDIAAKSKVWQTTGLDWEKVKLTLSTAIPNNGRTVPVMGTWFLRPYENVYRESNSRMKTAYAEEVMMMDEVVVTGMGSAPPAAAPAPTMDDYINVSENQLNITYDIDLLYTIPGNGNPQNIDLVTKKAEAEYRYYASPKLDAKAYLAAEISDWQELGLLSGSANVTYDGTYIGETFIDSSSTDEKLLLTLGTDQRIAVKREKTEDFSSKRTLGSDTEQIFTYRITVKNNRNTPAGIEVKDQYPVSTQKNIVVTLRAKETTSWEENNEATGIITWKAELNPGETRTYDISYSVRYPKGTRLNL